MNRIVIILLIFTLGACNSTEWVELKSEDGKLIERHEIHQKTKLKHGKAEVYDQEGKLSSRENYKDGKLNGERLMFYPDGDTMLIELYKEGLFQGDYRYYYEEGGLELEGQYVDNQMIGVWKRYYKSGQLMEEVSFKNNNENGPFVEYHENGKLKAKGNYLGGDKEDGLLELFDEQGTLIKKMNCERGICRTVWKKEKDDVIDEM